MGLKSWLDGCYVYWRTQWELAYWIADTAYDSYLTGIQAGLEKTGLAGKPEPVKRTWKGRLVRIALLAIPVYVILDWVF